MLFKSPGRAWGTQTHFPGTAAAVGRAVSPCHCPQLSTRGMMSPCWWRHTRWWQHPAAPSAPSSLCLDTAKPVLIFSWLILDFFLGFNLLVKGQPAWKVLWSQISPFWGLQGVNPKGWITFSSSYLRRSHWWEFWIWKTTLLQWPSMKTMLRKCSVFGVPGDPNKYSDKSKFPKGAHWKIFPFWLRWLLSLHCSWNRRCQWNINWRESFNNPLNTLKKHILKAIILKIKTYLISS